ncbi:DUF4214 domain-containing protein [Alloyangia pacifica]|uniref:DUF4214 domain-containing protein n=1 Tax=Alloyangia pacifica TaxID=311180 RepID=UPI001CD80851|nr:DUF4214 domain-containing protein [Alloyangia pacifica]MCA0998656.1 DUF4214 domain-containing protein [Alloyangia pacifica]
MTSQTPTAFEQQMLEYINRARLDPQAEADALIGGTIEDNIATALRYFDVDVTLFRQQLASYDPVAPLAWNSALAAAAETHTQAMIDADAQGHQMPGEDKLSDRTVDAGYEQWSRLNENVFAYAEDALHGHAAFYIDWGDAPGGIQDPAGHRNAILSSTVTEIGIGVLAAPAGKSVGPFLVTQDFGTRSTYQAQLLGVVIDDADDDDFYDIDEGLGGITVTAVGSAGRYTTTSWGAGGYQLALPEGVYEVSFSGTGIDGVVRHTVRVGSANLKLDALAGDAVAEDLPGTVLRGTAEDEMLVGSDGIDQVLIGVGGSDTLYGADGDDRIYGEQRIDAPAAGGAVYRLYQATLDRKPNMEGYGNWADRLDSGTWTLTQVADGFTGSQEFQVTYGALDTAAFVTLLYNNVLERAPDAQGLANWSARLDGGMSRAEVVTGFSQSAEFVAKTAISAEAYGVARMSEVTAPGWGDDVFRLYQATLDRAPDAGGFENWSARLAGGTDYVEVVRGFVQSAEFERTYGALDSEGFVTLLYNNVLDRAPDARGLENWSARLEGGMSRAEVVTGFAQSAEFIAATAVDFEAWMRAQGPDDVLDGGAGDNLLVGGLHSDVFVFDAAAGGSAMVADFEPWDTLRLEGFGFASAAEARAAFERVGEDLVLARGDAALTLIDTDLDLLTGARLELA